jgi:hypothetical protein
VGGAWRGRHLGHGWVVGGLEGAACREGGGGEAEAGDELGRRRMTDVTRMKMTRGSHAHPIARQVAQ